MNDPDAKQVRAVHDRHACRLDAASHSSRSLIGMVWLLARAQHLSGAR